MRNGEKQAYLFPRIIAIRPKVFPLSRKGKTDYRCKLCKKDNHLGSSGVGVLKKHELSEEYKANINLKTDHNFFSPRNATSSNSDSILLNHTGEATSHSENNVSVIANTSLQSTRNQNYYFYYTII